MPIAWTESQTLKLVILYSRHECLRNPFHPDFKNKLCRYKAYKQIVDSMSVCGLTVCDCIKRITCIKTQYCYELSKVSAAISCEKFYKPRATWFPIMHEILFPFINTYGCKDNVWKIQGDEKCADTFNDCYSNKTNDQLMYSNALELKKTSNKDCSCSYPNCCCEPYRTKPRTRSKKSWAQTDNDKVTDCSHLNPQVSRIDAGCSTGKYMTAEHGMQTDASWFQAERMTRGTCTLGSPVKSDLKDTPIDEGCKGKREGYDEFEMFGKSIASQLRNINFKVAIKLEKRIQDLIAQERLDNIKSNYASHTMRPDCCSSSCSDCKVMRKDMICSCGLPVIMIKADQSCELNCK